MEVNQLKNNSIQVELLVQGSRKKWVTPDIEIVGSDLIMQGTTTTAPEGVPTPAGFEFGVS